MIIKTAVFVQDSGKRDSTKPPVSTARPEKHTDRSALMLALNHRKNKKSTDHKIIGVNDNSLWVPIGCITQTLRLRERDTR